MNTAVIALGSNIDPEHNIRQALTLIAKKFRLVEESEFVQTKPLGFTDQADFINGSVLMETELGQEDLKTALKNMEQTLGRTKSPIKYGPRTIDLDIVVFNGQVVDNDFYERDFVRSAVLELLPDLEY